MLYSVSSDCLGDGIFWVSGSFREVLGSWAALRRICLVIAVLVYALLFFTYYQLRERDLYLHIGLLRKLSLPYEYILSAKRIRGGIYAVNPLSLSRFEIRYRQQGGGIGAVIVTPERPDTFIRELLKKNPHIDTTDLPPTQPGEGLDLPFPTVGTKKSKKAPETASRCKNPKGQE